MSTNGSSPSLRRVIFWLSAGCAGVALFAVIAVLLGVRYAPQRVIPRLPLLVVVEIHAVANREGDKLIAQRLRETAAQQMVIEYLQGSVRRQRKMLDMLWVNQTWYDMPQKVRDSLRPLCQHPDAEVRIAARKIYSAVRIALELNTRELVSGQEMILGSPPGPGSWIPDRIGCIGLSALTYLGAGYDHRMPSKYKLTVKALINELVAKQDEDGRFGIDARDHAIATFALAEAYAMSNDPRLKDPAQRGLDWILRESDAGPEVRWSANSDLAIWATMAMKSGSAGGLRVDLVRMNAWRKSHAEFGLIWRDHGVVVPVQAKDLLAQRALMGVFLGDTAVSLKIPAHDLVPDTTLSECTNYWLSLALFQVSIDFITASDAHHRRLLNEQTWDDGPNHGRLFPAGVTAAHCLRLLTLEIYYHYMPVGP